MQTSKVFLVREWGGDRILGQFRSGDSETGFLFSYLGEDAKIIAETRFLSPARKPGLFDGKKTRSRPRSETGFLPKIS